MGGEYVVRGGEYVMRGGEDMWREDVGRVVIVSKEEECSLISCNRMYHGNCICGFLRY